MNTSDIKLKLFRKIDSLNEDELKRYYNQILSLLSSSEQYSLKTNEKKAVDEALEYSKKGKSFTHEEVVEEARRKYPNLDIK